MLAYRVVATRARGPRLTIQASFHPEAVVPGAMAGDAPDAAQAEAAAAAHGAWTLIHEQLRDPSTAAEVWFSGSPGTALHRSKEGELAQLAGFARGVRGWLAGVQAGEPWPVIRSDRVELNFALPEITAPGEAFPLRVSLRLRRADPVEPMEVASTMPPHLPPAAEGEPETRPLQAFADEFEAAFDGALRLALDTGTSADGSTGELWAVRVGALEGRVLTAGSERHFFAPAPLSRQLQSGAATVRDYRDDAWTGGADDFVEVSRRFTSLDLDALAADFLRGVDDLLAPASAAAIARLAPKRLAELSDAREAIARAVARSVAPIFDPEETPGGAGDVESAAEALYRALRERLSAAYEVDAIVQLPVTVQAAPAGGSDLVLRGAVHADSLDASSGGGQFSDARLSLSPPSPRAGGDAQPLTFLFSATGQTERRSTTQRLRWTMGSLERRDVPGSTMRFVGSAGAPALAVELGEVEIPLPTRRFPTPPGLVRQETVVRGEDTPLADVLCWSYRMKVQQAVVAQDRLVVDARVNVPAPEVVPPGKPGDADGEHRLPGPLFEALVRYQVESPALWARADAVPAAEAGDAARRAEALAVVDRFTELVRDAAAAWQPLSDVVTPAAGGAFWLEDEDDGSGALRVGRILAAEGVLPWPEIDGYGAQETLDGEVQRYRPLVPPDSPDGYGGRLVSRTLSVPGLRPPEQLNARGAAWVVRNARLGPWKTNEAFVYTTPKAEFTYPVAVLGIVADLSLDGLEGATLAEKLASFFTAVLAAVWHAGAIPPAAGEERRMRLSVAYRYLLPMPEGGEGLPVTSPVLTTEPYPFQLRTDGDPARPGSFARGLLEALSGFAAQQQPPETDAAFVLDLTLFGADDLPLLELDSATLSVPPGAPDWWAVPGA